MDVILSDEETRVLGCLIEKSMATPEYYPLTLNALVNACNQKTNRDPVVSYDEQTVLQAIEGLKNKQLVWQSNLSRVVKYEEHFAKDCIYSNKEAAVMCILMLRGPQTVGEIRGRTERLHNFESLEEVNETLENLASLDHVVRLPRQPGRKEARYSHLLSEQREETDKAASTLKESPAQNASDSADRMELLEGKVEVLSSELDELKKLFLSFKKEFE